MKKYLIKILRVLRPNYYRRKQEERLLKMFGSIMDEWSDKLDKLSVREKYDLLMKMRDHIVPKREQ